MSLPSNAENLLAVAAKNYEEGDYKEAIENFSKSLALKEDWISYCGLGWAFLRTNQFQKAVDTFQKSLTLREDWNSYHGLGWALLNACQFEEAINPFRKSLAFKQDWNSYHGLGSALLNSNQVEESINAFKQSLNLYENWDSLQGLSWALFRMEQFAESIDPFCKSLNFKKDWNTFRGLGWAYFRINNFSEAINAFRESLQLKENFDSYSGLGWALFRKNKFADSIVPFKKSIDIKQDWNLYLGLGWALLRTKQFSEAIDSFNKSLAIKSNWNSYQGLGSALLCTNQFHSAIESFHKSLALKSNWNSYQGVGFALLNINKFEDAIEAYHQSLELQEDWKSYQGLGMALLKTKQFKAAINVFCNSISLKKTKTSYEGLLRALNKTNLNKEEERIREIIKTIPEDDNYTIGNETLEEFYNRLGNKKTSLNGKAIQCSYTEFVRFGKVSFDLNSKINSATNEGKEPDGTFKFSLIENAVITNIYGVHNREGIPYQEGIIKRGKYELHNDFPKGMYCKINLSGYTKFKIITSAIWLNYLEFKHIGHALTEMCANIYPLLIWAEKGLDISRISIIIPAKCSKYSSQLASILNIKSTQIVYVSADDLPLKINRLYIPTPTLQLRRYMHRNHADAVKAYLKLYNRNQEDSNKKPLNQDYLITKSKIIPGFFPRKIYLSRSKMPSDTRLFTQESDLEKELIEYGWTIIFPERINCIAYQLELYENAEFIAGTESSAFHVLMGIQNPNFRIILLSKVVYDPNDELQANLDNQFSSLNTEFKRINCLEYMSKDYILNSKFTSKTLSMQINDLTNQFD